MATKVDNNIDISYEMQLFRQRMAEKGYKSTAQRDEIARWIFRVHEHFTIGSIMEDFYSRNKAVAPATIYRVINLLLELELLVQHDFGKGQKYYEHLPGHPSHHHIICLDCNKIFEFENKKMDSIHEKECSSRELSLESQKLHLYAHCTNAVCGDKRKSGK